LRSFTFVHEELVLVLISLVRATHPSMLRQEADGFTIDFSLLDQKKAQALTDDERLLFKFRTVMDSGNDASAHVVHLTEDESARLVVALVQLQRVQVWPADVQDMCRTLCLRLAAPLPGA
jgi:hypothetical protein